LLNQNQFEDKYLTSEVLIFSREGNTTIKEEEED
jgi:hypothetical protein